MREIRPQQVDTHSDSVLQLECIRNNIFIYILTRSSVFSTRIYLVIFFPFYRDVLNKIVKVRPLPTACGDGLEFL